MAAECVANVAELLVIVGSPTLDPGSEPRVRSMVLVGGGGEEAVLLYRTPGDSFDAHPHAAPEDGATDHVAVFVCEMGMWRARGEALFDATADHGTFDYTRGVGAMSRREGAVPGGFALIEVTSEQAQGSEDPRWSESRITWLSVHEGALRRVFECVQLQDDVSGPDRAGTTTTRTLRVAEGTVRVEQRAVYDPGVGEGEEDEPEPVDDRGDYAWVDGAFVAQGRNVCEWTPPVAPMADPPDAGELSPAPR